MRFILSVWICKILIFAGRLAGKKGSSTPGEIAFKICPSVLKKLSGQIKKEIIAVCGTNGKTTTNNMLASILEKKGLSVVCNRVGANMLPGVVTAFIEKADLFGKLNADYACIEIDEASARRVFVHFTPDIMIITNLFRDQLDRYGEIDLTAGFLKEALSMCSDTVLLINCDDPICAAIGRDYKNKVMTFGISENLDINLNETKEGQFCSYCGEPLQYEYYHYSQLGVYKCSKCSFARPKPDFDASDVNIINGLSFTINNKLKISVDYRGFYNIYNIMAAVGAADILKIDLNDINEILSDYKPQIGRMEKFELSKQVILNLSKNPAGFNQAIFTVLADEREKDVIIMINDNAQDGRDISWIWDVDFEKLDNTKVKSIAFTGKRRFDTEVRFKYAGIIKGNRVYGDLKTAVIDGLKESGRVLYVLVNYTAIFDAQNILKELEKGM